MTHDPTPPPGPPAARPEAFDAEGFCRELIDLGEQIYHRGAGDSIEQYRAKIDRTAADFAAHLRAHVAAEVTAERERADRLATLILDYQEAIDSAPSGSSHPKRCYHAMCAAAIAHQQAQPAPAGREE